MAIQEIEKIVKNDFLDFEFGISDKEIIIFQTRPLILDREKIWDKKISRIINKNKNLLNKTEQSHIFSDMTDWNPAEIIGNSPNNLDYSIYDYLIMKKSWKFGRVVLGYTDVKPSNLMKKFGNKPYVDVRKSFSSLIPGNIKKNIKKKLLKFYLQKIQESKCDYLILRTDQPYCWIEKWQRVNSVIRLLNKFSENKLHKEVADWYNKPTFVPNFVENTMKLIDTNAAGIFHAVGGDFISRLDWCMILCDIFDLDKSKIIQISSQDLNLPAKRSNVNLNNEKITKKTGIPMVGVRQGAQLMFNERY